ncbi:MAG: hypothetical protein ABF451_09370, partial [Bifidobacterium aquikefiri]|uniref:hypothetical protein n=1 Tax=Bifidobacterium aquikefiri TaxID=1653207 RepID=UPI0039EA92F2
SGASRWYERQHHRHPERAERVEGSWLLMLARVRSLDSLRSLEMTGGGGFGRGDMGRVVLEMTGRNAAWDDGEECRLG